MDESRYARAITFIPDGFSSSSGTASRAVPIEKATDEPFQQRFEPSTKAVYRREQQLVDRLDRHLRRLGHRVTRHALPVPDGPTLYTDLFDHDTGLLVEAKAGTDRAAVRMAIGQLLDYRRHVKPAPGNCAVLLPELPSADLVELLDTLDIALVWRSGEGFRDNRSGDLVR